MIVMPHQVTPNGSIHNEWNERVQTGDPSPTPENARSVTGAICRLNRFLLTRLQVLVFVPDGETYFLGKRSKIWPNLMINESEIVPW